MSVSFDVAITTVIKHEGTEYTNTPGDSGGPTKFGITIPTLNAFDGGNHTAADIAALTLKTAQAVYLQQFWTPMCLQGLSDQRLATILLDQAVLNGKSGFTKRLQVIVGTMSDGIMGPQTVAACNSRNTNDLILDVLSGQTMVYIDLVTQNTTQLKFLRGWETRVVSLYDVAFRSIAISPLS